MKGARSGQRKCEERSTFGSMGSVRGKVSALFAIKIKYPAREHVKIMRFQTVCHHVNKKMNVSTEQHYTVKLFGRLKKLKVETIPL